MDKLARITVTDDAGRSVSLRAADVKLVRKITGGSQISFDDGSTLNVSDSVTTIHTAIDTLWDEYNTALGNP